ncbi:MAG TPA: oligosaccharide flippase family protein [Woeseiaceae bacterium]|nr:oligosaccharide flippase family protein [Woeseiaceae bacterium]
MVRRALVIATGTQYMRIAFRFVSIALVARLLTPAEIGLAVIGTALVTVLLALREFASAEFLIQRHEVTRDDIRASFTVLFLTTAVMTVAVSVLAPWIAQFYGEEQLAPFILISMVAGLIEAVSLPILGLLRRDLAFGAIAWVNTANAAFLAIATALFALVGLGLMSYAWGALAAALATTAVAFWFRPDLSILLPVFKGWGRVLNFGGYNGISCVINRMYGGIPQLFLGQLLPAADVGLYNRTTVASDIPDKVVLTSAFNVAFPAFAARVREGAGVKEPYLHALGLIAVVYWPAQMLLAILAYPVIWLFLGEQWLEGGVPLLQLMAIAGLAWFPVYMAQPVLLAVGANRDRVLVDLIGRSASAVGLCGAAVFGILAMAASKLVTIPFHMALSLWFVRRHVSFRWGEVGAALWRSAAVTAGTALGPLCIVALSEEGFALTLSETLMALALAAAGWLTGVLAVRHPVLLELRRALSELPELPLLRRLREQTEAHGPRAEEAR